MDILAKMYIGGEWAKMIIPEDIINKHYEYLKDVQLLRLSALCNWAEVLINWEWQNIPVPPVLANKIRDLFGMQRLPLDPEWFTEDLDLYNSYMADMDDEMPCPPLQIGDFTLSDYGEVIINDKPLGIFFGQDTFV